MNLVPRRFRGQRGLTGTRGLAVAGGVGFVLVPLVVGLTGSSGAALGVWRFLIISIALFSFAYGLKGGVAAGVAAVCVSAAWYFVDPSDPSSGAVVILRGLNYVVAGAIVGGLVDSRARALGALARHVSLSSDVIVSGADGYLDEVNPAFTRVLGHAVEDVVGRPYMDFVHPDDHEKSLDLEDELEAGRGPIATFENRYRHRDGTYRWLEWSVNLDPRLQEGFAVGRDITERKQAEEREQRVLADLRKALAKKEELQNRLVTVIESVLDGLIEIDEAGSVVMFNKAAEDMFGFSRDEVVGHNVNMLMPDPYHDDHDGYLARFHDGGEAHVIGVGREVAGRRKDGSVFPLDLAVGETLVDGKKVFVGIVRDITERKQAEEREHHYRQTLEWAVRDRTRELQEQTAALEEARLDTLQRLAMAGEYHDEDTYLHTQRVGETAALLASAYGTTREWVELIRLAAPLHDLGKLALSDTILLKQGALTDEEWEQVKSHPVVGAAILSGSSSEILQLAEEIALTHHEWWDGSGYPAGLRGSEIPLSGRIVTLADTFDALTHDRPYKQAWSVEEAIAEIGLLRGSRFDPDLVDVFNLLDPAQLAGDPRANELTVLAPHIRLPVATRAAGRADTAA